MKEFTIEKDEKDGIIIIRLSGDMDTQTCLEFSDFFRELSQPEGIHLLIDLQNLTYINSLGVGTLIGNIQRIQSRKGAVCFLKTSPEVEHVFNLAGITHLFQFFESESDALKYLSKHSQ